MPPSSRNSASNSVHPHGRGDNAFSQHLKHLRGGSPPRAWGQSRRSRPVSAVVRFTPTGVGTISADARIPFHNAVHPHGRGDNRNSDRYYDLSNGSPPRAWGQYDEALAVVPETRFTPTGVGTIRRRRRMRFLTTVHPHGRGDNFPPFGCDSRAGGSPPRAWGQLNLCRCRHIILRFTPTGVGTIAPVARETRKSAVHPHGRGDNLFCQRLQHPRGGSPPRAWGQSAPV